LEIRIKIDKPAWDPNPHKTTTNNHKWRVCCQVMFENQKFIWLPSYKQLAAIYKNLLEAEERNKQKAKELYGGKIQCSKDAQAK
jgi:hypothetical protein